MLKSRSMEKANRPDVRVLGVPEPGGPITTPRVATEQDYKDYLEARGRLPEGVLVELRRVGGSGSVVMGNDNLLIKTDPGSVVMVLRALPQHLEVIDQVVATLREERVEQLDHS